MNKFKIFVYGMIGLMGVGFTSCQADEDPKLNEPTEFVLNTPPFAGQLYQLTPDTDVELTCSQPNYGLALAPTYSVDVSLLENFGADLEAPAEGAAPYLVNVPVVNPQSAVLTIQGKALAEAMCELLDINDENYEEKEIVPVPLYVRVNAAISDQPSTMITSNIIKLDRVLTYYQSKTVVLDVIYTPGNSNGWNFDNCQQLLSYEDGKYRGFMYINGDFKFTGTNAWDNDKGNWGLDGENPVAGKLVNNGSNITMPETGEGLYFADVNTTDLTYTLTFVESVGVVGAFNSWNQADDATHMTHSADYLIWKYEGGVSGEFKFVFNNSWDINLGGSTTNLEFNGGNLSTDGASVITLDLSKLPYTATAE